MDSGQRCDTGYRRCACHRRCGLLSSRALRSYGWLITVLTQLSSAHRNGGSGTPPQVDSAGQEGHELAAKAVKGRCDLTGGRSSVDRWQPVVLPSQVWSIPRGRDGLKNAAGGQRCQSRLRGRRWGAGPRLLQRWTLSRLGSQVGRRLVRRWQRGHQKRLRLSSGALLTGVPHTRHGWPLRR